MERVLSLAEPLAHTMGFEVLLAEETSERDLRILRIYLEGQGNGDVSIADCADFSRALSPILDVEGDIAGKYNLEISSPGLNRPLVKKEHFEAHLGKVIQVVSENGIEGRHKFKGILKEITEDGGETLLSVDVDGDNFKIPLSGIKKSFFDYFATQELVNGNHKVLKIKKVKKDPKHATTQAKDRQKRR